jgi:hypothetical protein
VDVLTLGDQANANDHTYTVTSSTVARTVAKTTTYSGIESLNVNAGTGNNSIDISSTQNATTTTIHAGSGNDSIAVTPISGNLSYLFGDLLVHGDTGSDSMTVWDHFATGVYGYSYLLDESSLSREASGQSEIRYQTAENVTLNAGAKDNIFYVGGTAAGVQTTVNGGDGLDFLIAGMKYSHSTCSSGTLAGELTFNGEGGYDQLTLCDKWQGDGGIYIVAPTTISKVGGATVAFAGVEIPAVEAGNNRDLLIAGPRAGFFGHAGEDILIGGTTVWDADPVALNSIMAEWTRTDLTYIERVNHLLNGGGLNGGYTLNASTVHGNGVADYLEGGYADWTDHAPNLFFAEMPLDFTDHNSQAEILVAISPPPIPPFSGPDREPVSSERPDEVAPLATLRDYLNAQTLIDEPPSASVVKSLVLKRVSQPVKPMKSRPLLAPIEDTADIFRRL